MSLKITGSVRIFKNNFNGKDLYSTTISRKLDNGEYENMYIAVQFKKGQECEGMIDIKNAFMTYYKTNTGLQKLKLIILDYEKENEWISTDDMPDLPF